MTHYHSHWQWPAGTEEVANRWHIPHWTTDPAETLESPGLDAVILASPTQTHARRAPEVMCDGKLVLIEIPNADSVADSERIVQVQ